MPLLGVPSKDNHKNGIMHWLEYLNYVIDCKNRYFPMSHNEHSQNYNIHDLYSLILEDLHLFKISISDFALSVNMIHHLDHKVHKYRDLWILTREDLFRLAL